MVEKVIKLKELNLKELNGVVNIYPWYGVARKELCRRMSELGEGAWSDEKYAEAALYVVSRQIIARLARKGRETGYSDSSIKGIIRSNFPGKEEPGVIIAGGDYFSQNQYDVVKQADDNIFSSFARHHTDVGGSIEEADTEEYVGFCTETLAEIYEEQGYYEQAKDIYSKLSLRYPEKSVYFASLIEKLNNKNKI
ncbi:MAG: hypothetical protein MJY51_04000 [Bacteroidales bacterium]|nr:hypothetical protein [Bacteroidales bacterium]